MRVLAPGDPASPPPMLPSVEMLDAMDEQMWRLLQRNLAGLSEAEAEWRPHPSTNNVRWILGHLTWFEEWAHDAIQLEGRYLHDRDPIAYTEGTIGELMERFRAARGRYRHRLAALDISDLGRELSYFGHDDVTVMALLQSHALHLAGHRFQVRYVRGAYARAHGTSKAAFDPW